MLLAAVSDISLHRGAEGVAEAVRVMIGEHVLVLRKGIEPGLVEQITPGQFAVTLARAPLPCQVEVLWHRVVLVPGVVVGGVVAHRGPPALLRLVAVECGRRQVRHGRIGGAVEQRPGLGNVRKGMCVDQAADYLVVVVAGKAKVGIELAGNRRGVEIEQSLYLGARLRIAIHRIATRQCGDPLPEAVGGGKTVAAAGRLVERHLVVPATEIWSRCRQPCTQPPRLEQTVVVQPEEHGLGLLELGLRKARSQVHVAVAELIKEDPAPGLGEECGA